MSSDIHVKTLMVADSERPRFLKGQGVQGSLVLFSGLALLAVLGLRAAPRPDYALPVAAWFAAIGSFLGACSWHDRRLASLDSGPRPLGIDWSARDTLLVVLTLLIAVALRVPALGQSPRTMLGDEGAMGLEALAVIEHRSKDPFGIGWHSHPVLWFFLQSYSLRLFGDSLAGLRMLSAIAGSATVATTYVLSRLIFPRHVAAMAALLLATYHFHIHFSRLALFNIADPLIGTVSLGLFAAALRTRRVLLYGGAGIVLGLGLYFYPGARLFVLLVGLIGLSPALWQLARERSGSWSRRSVAPAVIVALGILIAAAPLLQTYLSRPATFGARMEEQGITEPGWLRGEATATGQTQAGVLFDQVRRSALAFTHYADTGGFYDDRRPLAWGLAGPLMLLGLLLALRRLHCWPYRMLAAWLVLTVIFGGVLLRNPPGSARYVTLAPVVCLFIALAVHEVIELVGRWKPRVRLVTHAAAGMLIAYLSITSTGGYFVDYLAREPLGGPPAHTANALARYLQQQPAGASVWFLGAPRMYYHGFPMLDFLVRDASATDVIGRVSIVPAPAPGRMTIYAALPERRTELQTIRERYPGGETQTLYWPSEAGPLLYVYRLGHK